MSVGFCGSNGLVSAPAVIGIVKMCTVEDGLLESFVDVVMNRTEPTIRKL